MATTHAIAVVARSVRDLLASHWVPTGTPQPEFTVFTSRDLQVTDRAATVSVYLHRVAFNTSRRSPAARREPDGTRFRPSVPVDLHLLITAWGRSATEQQDLLGWAIRTLEDQLVLPAGLLNASAGEWGQVFHDSESIELVGDVLNAQELISIWEVAKTNQQPSVSYIARSVLLDSRVGITEAGPVQTRIFDFAKV